MAGDRVEVSLATDGEEEGAAAAEGFFLGGSAREVASSGSSV